MLLYFLLLLLMKNKNIRGWGRGGSCALIGFTKIIDSTLTLIGHIERPASYKKKLRFLSKSPLIN